MTYTTYAQSTYPDLPFAPRRISARAAAPLRPAARLHALLLRLGSLLQSHDDYFAELDRSLPEHARERRRERRTTERLSLIATLGR